MLSFTKLKSIAKRKVINKDAPTLIAIMKGNKLYAWCPFCKEFHRHGVSEGTVTYRNAHCTPKSPFYETGYNIIILNEE